MGAVDSKSAHRVTSLAPARGEEQALERSRERATAVWPLPCLGLLLAVPAGAIAAARGFDGLYGQDAYAYFDYATGSVRHSLLTLAPLESFFWPPGYPLLVALVSLAVGPVAIAGQAVSLLMGALAAVLTALVVRELWPDDTPLVLISGALVALCGQLWQSSVVVMADTTGLAMATLSAWALVRYLRHGRARWLVVASAAIAYATLARWIYGLVAIPFAAYAVWAIRSSRVAQRGSIGRTENAQPRAAAIHAVAALAVAAATLAPVLGPSLVSLLTHPAEPAAFAGNLQVYSWAPLNAVRREFQTADGHLAYALPNGIYYAIAPANFAFLGPLLAPWILAGLWASRRWPRPTLVLIVGWAAIVYAFHAGAPWQNFRFSLAYLPPLAVLTAAGVLAAWRYADWRLRSAVAICAALGMLVSAGSAVRLVEGFIDRKDSDLALVRWVQDETPPAAQLFTFGPTLTFRHYTNLPTFDLFDVQGRAELDAILAPSTPQYVLVDEASLQGQWQGQRPEINFRLLRDGPGLTRLGAAGSYTLYRVDAR